MADVILFRPKISKGQAIKLRSGPPLGLLFVAAPLVENNFSVKIIDEEISFHWIGELRKELNASTICVGISSMTGSQILGGLKFAKVVKDEFNIPVVWGGLHASMLPEQTLENELVDIVVRGEGEEAFFKIVTALKGGDDLKHIQNVWCKKDGKIYADQKDRFVELNNLPLLPYYLIDWEKYIGIKRDYFPGLERTFDLNTDRGCPHRCSFCYNININKNTWRGFSAFRLVEQIEYLVRKFSLEGINFISDNFFYKKNRVADICNEIIKRRINIAWCAQCRIDYFAEYEDSFIDLLKRSGCKTLTFGIESGSQKVLDLMRKDINIDDVFKVNEKIKKWQLGVNYSFMVGFPGETKKDVLQTYKLMWELYNKYPRADFFGPSVYTPYPGTPSYYKCLEMGFNPPDKLRDWAKFEWNEKSRLPFIEHNYSDWLKRSVYIVSRFDNLRLWVRWWFRIRTRMLIKFKMPGPVFEEKLFQLIKTAREIIVMAKLRLKKD